MCVWGGGGVGVEATAKVECEHAPTWRSVRVPATAGRHPSSLRVMLHLGRDAGEGRCLGESLADSHPTGCHDPADAIQAERRHGIYDHPRRRHRRPGRHRGHLQGHRARSLHHRRALCAAPSTRDALRERVVLRGGCGSARCGSRVLGFRVVLREHVMLQEHTKVQSCMVQDRGVRRVHPIQHLVREAGGHLSACQHRFDLRFLTIYDGAMGVSISLVSLTREAPVWFGFRMTGQDSDRCHTMSIF